MTRGRLIWPAIIEIAPIDTEATEAADRYDFRMREPKQLSDGTKDRVEGTPFRLNCQFETEGDAFEDLRMMGSGDSPNSQIKVLLHFEELEDLGMVDVKGRATIRKGDRLVKVMDCDEILIQDFDDVPLFATEVQPRDFGLSGQQRNLLLVTFTRRDTSTLDLT